jgi:hypothetical protein
MDLTNRIPLPYAALVAVALILTNVALTIIENWR